MKRKPIALLLILSMLLALSLTGCGKDTALTVYAEGNFIRQDLIDAFTEETGIEVNYIIGTRSPAETKAKTDDANSTKTDSSADEEVVLPEVPRWTSCPKFGRGRRRTPRRGRKARNLMAPSAIMT